MKRFLVLFVSLFFLTTALADAEVTDFEDLSLDAESYWNGSDDSGGFTSGGVRFNNYYDDTYGPYWEGFAYSNMTDTQTPYVSNQYSAITGIGVNGSSNYAVSYIGFSGMIPTVTFSDPIAVPGVYLTNTTYAYWSMMKGDAFAKKFGGNDGNDPDWFLLTITGKDADDNVIGTAEFYLADYRSEDNSVDYIIDQWTWVDLSNLGQVAKLEFTLSSSDVGDYGMNTPAYFAMDYLNPPIGEIGLEDLSLDAESYWNGSDESGGFSSSGASFNNYYDDTYGPYWEGFAYSNMTDTQTPDYTNQYSAITGIGVNSSSNYAVSYSGFYGIIPTVTLPEPIVVSGAYITNTTYAFWSMKEGDAMAKRFGGDTGDDPDWFLLTIKGIGADGGETGTVKFYLADYRSEDNSVDYIIDQWTWVDLSNLGQVAKLEFTLSSSDVGDYGMNTPAYFAMDHLNGFPFPAGSDLDGDGILDDQEVDSGVDLNGDETPDRFQDVIKSVNAAVGDWQIGISIEDDPNVTKIVEIKAIDPNDPAAMIDETNMPANMPWGLLNFKLKVKDPGDEVTVKVYFSRPVPDGARWYKYEYSTNVWLEYPYATLVPGSKYVTLQLKDGDEKFGDSDGQKNGIIIDPSGLAIFSSSSGGDAGSTAGGGGGGCFINTAASGSKCDALHISLAVLVLGTLTGGCLALRSSGRGY